MALTKLTTDLIDGTIVTSVNGSTGAVTLETGTDWQSTPKTADFTAVAGEGYFVNTTSAAITVTLPSSPSSGDEVNLVDYAGTADTNNITITSSDNINGSSNDHLIDYERGGVAMVYVDATQGWVAYNAANETATALIDNPPTLDVDYLVVAGGGGGVVFGGGGGAGGLRTSYGNTSGGGSSAESSLNLDTATNYTVTVGSGGNGGTNTFVAGFNGSNSVFSSITSIGGGGGNGNGNGNDGGSGGGGSLSGSTGGAGTANQGFAAGDTIGAVNGGCGGGGAGAVGNNATTQSGANGGAGLEVNIIGGTGNYYAGGGAGGGDDLSNGGFTGGTGGIGGGGDGSISTAAGDGTANTGGGAGGSGRASGGQTGSSGNGGSGVVIIRYPNTHTVTIGSGLTGTTATDGSDKVTTFTAGTGNISFS